MFRLCLEQQGCSLTWRKPPIRLKVSVKTIVTSDLKSDILEINSSETSRFTQMYLGEPCAVILNQLWFTSVICLRVTHTGTLWSRWPVGTIRNTILSWVPVVSVLSLYECYSGGTFFFNKKTSHKTLSANCQIFLMASMPALTSNQPTCSAAHS